MISLYGYKLTKQRYGKMYYAALEHYTKKDYSDIEVERSIQNRELVRLIKYAVKNSKFYKNFYKDIDVYSIKTVNDLQYLPILEKELLRKNLDDIYTISNNEAISSFTGGTTGKSLKVRFTKKDSQVRMAYLDAFKAKHGFSAKSKKATFSGRKFTRKGLSNKHNIFWRYNFFYKQKLYSTFDMNDKNMQYYIDDLNHFKPEILNGFVSALYELAAYADRHKITFKFTPKAIFTTSETLLPIHRTLIEKIFKSKVFNQYASAEGAPFVTECEFGNLHYNIDTGVIEILETASGSEILVTSFTSFGTPLIRYRIGDKIKFKEGRCKCKSSHPLVESIDGRKVDYLYSIEHGKVSLSHLADVIKGIPNSIKNIQFVQNEVNSIIINMVIDSELYTKEMDKIVLDEMLYIFGKKTKFNIVILDYIPKYKSGKASFIVNNLSENINLFL
jgi:phenylacetate-CoA ligase